MRMDVEQRRARLGQRHRLTPATRTTDPVEAARSVVGLHATDPATVYLSVWTRGTGIDVATVERALYDERSLLRMLGMRRTMFVVPTGDAPVVQASSSNAVAEVQRRRYAQLIGEAGLGDAAWLAELEMSTVEALRRRGTATGAQLSADVPGLRSQIQVSEGKAYGGPVSITTWVLLLAALDGHIVRGRPRGSWVSTQWSWAPVEAWLPTGLETRSEADARVELVRRWLAAFGPGTVADLKWWTGWTLAQLRPALAAIAPVEVDLGGATGLLLPDDPALTGAPPRRRRSQEQWVALLPALDPTPMGWTERDWYLGPHRTVLFDRSGNIGPTVWCDGRVVGGWAHRRDGEIAYRLLEDIGAEATDAVARQAAELGSWIGDVRITPRFRTPLEKELVG